MEVPLVSVCDRCERPWAQWPAGRCVISQDLRGLCPPCLAWYESTGATIDVQWFPGTEFHFKEADNAATEKS